MSFGNVTDIDGNVYETVQIGEQLWMAENLKVTHYNNGDEIPAGYSDEEDWTGLQTGRYAVYDNDPSNADIYGNLYNWMTVYDDRGVCPEGCHVPSDEEWTILTDYLGGKEIAGGKMKEEGHEHWFYYSDEITEEATNESGFMSLPAGQLFYSYDSIGERSQFWSSSIIDSDFGLVWYRELNYNHSEVNRYMNTGPMAYWSIRCLADEITSGCTDPDACNYDETANIDDGSCDYEVDCAGQCGGDAVIDECGECGGDGANVECGCEELDYNEACCPIENMIDCLCTDDDEVAISICSEGSNPCPLDFDGDGICNPWDDCDYGIDDCPGECGGSAYLDECSVCSEGNTGHEPNSDMDLCSECFGDNSTCCLEGGADNYLENGGCEYHYSIELHEGPNLISFWALPDDNSLDSMFINLDGIITGVIGEGTAAVPNDLLGWIGSLSEISCTSGYWIMVSEDVIWDIVATELCFFDLVYEIKSGINLVSWPSSNTCSLGYAIPDEFEENVCGVIGEGVAAIPNETFGWIGSLDSFQGGKGYWLCSDVDMYFNWDAENCEGTLSRKAEQSAAIPAGYEYKQSTQQAFYFIESIENIEMGDWILSYNDDVVIGAREWTGNIIDVPAMGSDGSDYTKGYMEAGSVPSFKILRDGELIDLGGDIPAFENNQLYMVLNLTEAVALPEAFSLDRAYPNPFNPTTTLSFALPVTSNVLLEVYDINGRLINELIKSNMDAGYHSVVWNADSQASGVYFVKMLARPSAGGVAGEYIHTQKLMLIK